MNTNLLAIVTRIIAENGENILADARRLKAFFSDLAKDEPKPLRIAFGRCIEEGAYNALKTAPDAAERAARKTVIAERVRDEHGLDVTLCGEALDILEAALFGEQQPRILCKSCGKELEKNWKMCPHCGTASPALPSPQPVPPPGQPPPAVAPAVQVTPSEPAGFVQINGGTFYMGSPANEPERFGDEVQHQVTVCGFSMGKHEVTQREWREVMGNNPSNWKGDNLPVEQVSWYDAVEYCNKRSQREGLTPAYTIEWTNVSWSRSANVSWSRNANGYQNCVRGLHNRANVSWNRNANGYRLPTEAEWEYACRAGTTGPFNTGNNITTRQANYDGNYPYNNNAKGIYRERTVEVGSFAANRWGLYDMHGNVWEWCWDWYGNYSSGPQSDPIGPSTGANRVRRGGSWSDIAQYLRSAYRNRGTPSYQFYYLGFRLVRSR